MTPHCMMKKAETTTDTEEFKLSELLILAALWMLFGFMMWFYLSAFHVIPARVLSGVILGQALGQDFVQIVAEANRHYLYQVETRIPFVFPDGTTEALGFIVNPLIFSYGLPLLFGLVMGSGVTWARKAGTLLLGYVVITAVQVWGVVWQSLKMLAFNFGEQTHAIVYAHGIPDSLIAICYQVGTLILPALAPVLVWILANRALVEKFVGWDAGQIGRNRNP
jgi:hypothetical protein